MGSPAAFGRGEAGGMSKAWIRIYHRLPQPCRSAAAAVWGLRLRFWRYGPESERLVTEALQRDYWQPQQWEKWRAERLGYILHRAATRVPYYREQWEMRRRRGDRASWDRLENWAVLKKETVRANPRAFVADDCDPRRMFHDHTSGTTGTPLSVWLNRNTVRAWYALFEARCRRWYGVSRFDRWGSLGGQLVTPADQRKPPFCVCNPALNQLYLSSYHLAPDLMQYYLEALERYRIRYLLGYTSSLCALAQEALRAGRQSLNLRVIVTNAEPLLPHQRQMITEAFQCAVRETYGMAEIAAAATECEWGQLHLWPEAGCVEVLDHDNPTQPGACGDIVATGLLNADMPLIRYTTGDLGALAPNNIPCSCGRLLPVLASVDGRADDLLYTADGRRIGRMDPVFKSDLAVREAQIIQETLGTVRVRYVPAAGFTDRSANRIIEAIRSRLGPVEVLLESVSQLPREANGKFRAVICRIPPEQRPDRQRCGSELTSAAV